MGVIKIANLSDLLKGKTDAFKIVEDEFVHSGSAIFDAVISNGKGIPTSKFIEIASESGLGKTTAILHIARTFCENGKEVLYFDIEKATNGSLLKSMGLSQYIDEGLFFCLQISTFNEAEDLLEKALKSQNLGLIVFDSITSLITEKEISTSIDDIEPAHNARATARFLPKWKSVLSREKSQASIVFINQTREHIDLTRRMSYTGSAGGNAQKFNMDIRLIMKKKSTLEEKNPRTGEKEPYGSEVILYAEKNRFNRPKIKGIFTIIFGQGISDISAYYNWLLYEKFIQISGGGWHNINIPGITDENGIKLQGRIQTENWIDENLEVLENFINSRGGLSLVDKEEKLE